MSSFEEVFNRSGFSRFINSSAGRIFRLVAGLAFLVVGFVYRHHTLGVLSIRSGVYLAGTLGEIDVIGIKR